MFNDKSIVWLVFCGLLVFAFSLCSFGALADIYPGDVGIESDPAVVFTENFEEGSIGAVTARWESVQRPDIMSLVPDTPPLSSGNNSILIAYVETNPATNSGYLYRRLLPGYDQLYLRFYVKFAADCHKIHHFVHMGGYNPSTPWPMGGAGDSPVGDDRLSTGIEPMGDYWRWDFYSYWMEMRSWQTSGGVPDGRPNPYFGNTFIRDNNLAVVKGEWICVELMMKMNNPTTSHNGEQAIWINGLPWYMGGQLVSHLGEGFPNGYWNTDKWYPNLAASPFEGFRWRSTEDLNLNFVWLLAYITTKDYPGHINNIWFDDVVVATEYIGPLNTIPHYTLTVNGGSGDENYEENEIVPISAGVISGLTFDEWIGDTTGIANIYAANTTLTMPALAVTITATYTGTQTYQLTVNSGSGDGLHEENQIVPISADPGPPGEEFSHWADDTAGIANVNIAVTTITMPPQPTTITAMYKPQEGFIGTIELGDATGTNYPGTIEDTWCRGGGGQDFNYSTNLLLSTYTSPVNTIANTIIIKWDLAAIPPDATIDEAVLYLYQINAGGDSLYELPVHKIINVNPVISAVTWNKYDGVNSWIGGGQNDIAPAEDTQQVNSTINEYKTWTVTDMVQDWVSAPISNYGLFINSDGVASSNSYRTFASNEVAGSSTRPKLIVTYSTPLTGDSEPDGDVDFFDFAAFALQWRDTGCAELNDWCYGADFNHLDDVNLDDLKALTDNWLVGVE